MPRTRSSTMIDLYTALVAFAFCGALTSSPPNDTDDTAGAAGVTALAQDDAQGAISRTEFVLTGRVLGADGLGVPGATVRASTVERDGKFARWSGAATADGQGAYELAVPFVGALAGRSTAALVLEAGHLGYVHASDTTVDARPATRASQDLVVALPPGERAGDYVLDVLVRDARGNPVEGAKVELTHVAPRDRARVGPGVPFHAWSSSAEWLHLDESQGRTGPDGRARLSGARLGAKSLWIEPVDAHAPQRTALAITAEGAHARDVTVAEGRVLHGTLAWVDGTPWTPEALASIDITAVLELNRWRRGKVAEDGTFRVAGLAAAPLQVRVGANWNWPPAAGERPSSAVLELTPRDAPFDLALKRASDPRDIGVHDAELHGVARDARTGEALPLAPYDLFVWPLWELPEGDLQRDILPNVIHAPPVQRMAGPGAAQRAEAFHDGGLAAGAYMVQATPRGHGLGLIGPIVLGPREVRAGLELRIGAPATIDVFVRGADGAPIEGAWVYFTGIGPHSDGVLASVDARYREIDGLGSFFANGGRRTDAAGHAQLGGLPPGISGVVAVVHPATTPTRGPELKLSAGATQRVDLRPSGR